MCDDNIQIWLNRCESPEEKWAEGYEGRPLSGGVLQASVSGSSCRLWCVLLTDDGAYARWQKLDLSSCRHESAGASVWKGPPTPAPPPSPPPPVNIQLFSSFWHPQDKALHLPPFLFLFLNLRFLPSLPQPPSARTPPPPPSLFWCL